MLYSPVSGCIELYGPDWGCIVLRRHIWCNDIMYVIRDIHIRDITFNDI